MISYKSFNNRKIYTQKMDMQVEIIALLKRFSKKWQLSQNAIVELAIINTCYETLKPIARYPNALTKQRHFFLSQECIEFLKMCKESGFSQILFIESAIKLLVATKSKAGVEKLRYNFRQTLRWDGVVLLFTVCNQSYTK